LQTNCPSCAQRIVIDDARVPDRPFSVKCPKCQTSVRLPGKSAAPAAAPPAPPPAAAPMEPVSDAGGSSDEMRAQMMAQLRREMTLGEPARAAVGRVLISLSDRGQAGSIALPLTRQGYQVDTLDNAEEGARLLEQSVYTLVVTTRAAAAQGRESLYQRINRLGPDARRRLFVVLVGDDFKTGDGTQAWMALADLVVNTKDIATADVVLTKTIEERTRLYQTYNDARQRFEASAV